MKNVLIAVVSIILASMLVGFIGHLLAWVLHIATHIALTAVLAFVAYKVFQALMSKQKA